MKTKRPASSKMLSGKSIRGQLTTLSQNTGVVIYTFWYDNTVTRIDGWGHTKEYVSESLVHMREFFELKVKQGYMIAQPFSEHPNNVDTYKCALFC